MTYVIKISNASVRGDAYVRVGAEPESDNVWVIARQRAVETKNAAWQACLRFSAPEEAMLFTSLEEAHAWRRRRIAFQRARGKTAGRMVVTRKDARRAAA